jgi:hypothetical protein
MGEARSSSDQRREEEEEPKQQQPEYASVSGCGLRAAGCLQPGVKGAVFIGSIES